MAFVLGCECGNGVRVETTQAGMAIPCPKCGKELAVPSLGELRRINVTPDAPRDRSASGEGIAALRIIGVGLFLMAIVISFAIGVAVPLDPRGEKISPFHAASMALFVVGSLLIVRSKGYDWLPSVLIAAFCPCAALVVLFLPDRIEQD